MDLSVFYEQSAAFGPCGGVEPRPPHAPRRLPAAHGLTAPWKQVWEGLRRMQLAHRSARARWDRLWCCRLCGHIAQAEAFGVRLEASGRPSPAPRRSGFRRRDAPLRPAMSPRHGPAGKAALSRGVLAPPDV